MKLLQTIHDFFRGKTPVMPSLYAASNPVLNSRDLILFFAKNKDLEPFSPYYIK